MFDQDRFDAAIARFDELHRQDPGSEPEIGEDTPEDVPQELLYARRMSTWLERLAPGAPEAVRLAAHCQHLRRFELPRSDYPTGRRGYLDWRNECKRRHAELAARVLREVGYDPATVERVQDLVLKRRLKADPESQLLEDVVCLVFLESYFAAFSQKHEDEKLVDILRKTWRKMSPRGHAAALALALEPRLRSLVEAAVSEAEDR